MIYPPIEEGPELHDLTGPHGCSLLPIIGELRQREAARTARAARRRGSWLRKAAARLRDTLRRGDRPRAGQPETKEPAAPPEACRWCQEELGGDCLRIALLDTTGALMLARNVAERDGEKALRDALHHLLVINLVPGEIEHVACFLHQVSKPITGALAVPRKEVN